MGGELLGQPFMRAIGLGNHQEAGRVLVETVHDPGPHDATDAGEARPAMGDEGVDQGARRVAGPGMYDETFWLVDDDEVRILVHDGERHRLSRRLGGLGRWYVQRIGFAGLHPAAHVLDCLAPARNVAAADECLQPGAAEVWQVAREEAIEPLAAIHLAHRKLEACVCLRTHDPCLLRAATARRAARASSPWGQGHRGSTRASLPHSCQGRGIGRVRRIAGAQAGRR